MKERSLTCWHCGFEPTPGAFLDGVQVWWSWLNVAKHLCVACGGREDVQLFSGEVIFGYLYAAGTAHFAGMERASIPGLVVERTQITLILQLGEATWSVPVHLS